MIKMECENCHRFYFIEGDLPDDIKGHTSHTTCAQCLFCDEKYRGHSNSEHKRNIRAEMDEGIIWQGQEKKFKDYVIENYIELAAEVMSDREAEHNQEGKNARK